MTTFVNYLTNNFKWAIFKKDYTHIRQTVCECLQGFLPKPWAIGNMGFY